MPVFWEMPYGEREGNPAQEIADSSLWRNRGWTVTITTWESKADRGRAVGLSVGVVSIDYLEEPRPPVSDFLRDLAMNPDLGMDGDHWGGGWGENTFLEFEQDVLTEHAESWCTQRAIDATGRATLTTWISSLPDRNGYVMLHLVV